MSTPTPWRSIGLVALGALCYSTLIIFTRLTHDMGAMSIAFFRAFFAFLFFCLLLIRFREPFEFSRYRSGVWALVASGLAMGLTAALYIFAVQHTTAANSALLVNSAPIYIAFLAPWFLKEARPRFTWHSLALILVGILLITGVLEKGLTLDSLSGILAGVLSGFTYALTMLFSRFLRGKASGFTQTFWNTGVASLLLLPFALQGSWDTMRSNLPVLIPLGVISLGIASFLYFVSLQKLKAQVVSVVAILEPVSGVLIGILLYQEPLTPASIIGSLLILFSIYLISR